MLGTEQYFLGTQARNLKKSAGKKEFPGALSSRELEPGGGAGKATGIKEGVRGLGLYFQKLGRQTDNSKQGAQDLKHREHIFHLLIQVTHQVPPFPQKGRKRCG